MSLGTPCPRSLAQALLLAQKPARLPVRVERLRFERSLLLDSLGHYCALTGNTLDGLTGGASAALQDGCTLVRQRGGKRVYIILYNEGVGSTRRRSFTLAHEVGHIYLEHTEDDPVREREADAFAAELLMPRVLAAEYLKMAGGRGNPAGALSQVFGVSLAMARVSLQGLGWGEVFTEREEALLARYRVALPDPAEPEIAY